MVDGADCVCRFPDEALVGVAQAPSPEGVLVTVQHEGVICYDALLKKRTSSWPLASDTTAFTAPAVWDRRSRRLFAAVSAPNTKSGSGKPAAGQRHLLLSWPLSHGAPIEDARAVGLPSPVHSLHPIFSAAQHAPAELPAAEAAEPAGAADSEGVDEASVPEAAERAQGEAQGAEQKAAGGSLQEQAWVREWVEAGRGSDADSATQEEEAPCTSGRGAARPGSPAAGLPGVFVVHTNGTVGLDSTYTSTSNGHAHVLGAGGGVAVAAASHGGFLAVVTAERKRKHFLSCFSVQANALVFAGRARLAPPQRSAEVVSAALEGGRLALAWSDGTVQSLAISTAPDAQVSVRQAFARTLASCRAADAARLAPPLRNGRCHAGAAAARKRAAQEGGSAAAGEGAAGSLGFSAAAPRAALVPLGDGLLGAVIWGEARAGEGSAAAVGQALLLGPAAGSSGPGRLQHAGEQGDDQEGGSEQQHSSGSGSKVGGRLAAGVRAPGSAEGGGGQALRRTVRVVVFEERYGCVCALHEAAWDDGAKDPSARPAGSALPGFQVALIGAGGRLAIAARGAVLLRIVGAQQQQPSLASLVGALSLDGAPRGAAARLQRSALAFPPPASDAPAHSHFRPPWAERGAAAGLPLHAQAARIAVPLREEHIGRWQRAAEAVAADQGLEREAAAQLARAGSLGSADAAARLVAQLLPRAQGGPGGVAAALLPRVVERCAEHGHWSVLASLASHQQLPCFAACPGLLARLAGAHQYRLLASAAAQAAGVLPSELEAALRFLLAEPPSEARAQLAAWEEHIAATAESAVAAAEASVGVEGLAEASLARAQAVHMAVEGFSAQEVCLHALVAGRRDTAVLLAAVRKLPPPLVLALLTYLRKWVERQAGALASLGPGQVPSLPEGLALPSFGNILQWAAAALDAHFPALSGRPEAFPTAAKLQRAVQEDLRVSQKVAGLAGVMEHMRRQAALPTFSAAAAQLYSAELLDLRVRHAE